MKQRALLTPIKTDLRQKMVFLSGPRQVGKTTLAQQLAQDLTPRLPLYLNWDQPEHRKIIRELAWSRKPRLVILDEVHKYARWKQLIKGFYDTEGKKQAVLVTGSARLDYYRKGGESLVGRYMGFRLHPFSIGELTRQGAPPPAKELVSPHMWGTESDPGAKSFLRDLLAYGGFPEPFLSANERAVRRWRIVRQELIFRQDLRELTLIRHISLVEQLMDLLRERIGSPVSIHSLCEDLQVNHNTVKTWLDALERLYVIFRVQPYSGNLTRTFRKEGKVYFWDWGDSPGGGPRFENFVASHLLKLCDWLRDVEGYKMDLRFVRDREKREVDFLILKEKRPWVLVEAKQSRENRHAPLYYFKERLKVPFAFQVIEKGLPKKDIFPAESFFASLP